MRLKNLALLVLLFMPTFVYAEKSPRAINDVLKNARKREKVLIEGDVTKALSFDLFEMKDTSGVVLVNLLGLKHDVKIGDHLLVQGRYQGWASNSMSREQVDVLAFTATTDAAEKQKFIEKYGFEKTVEEGKPAASAYVNDPAAMAVETRLKKLDDLKSKGLVTEQEYNEQRKRILNSL